MCTKYNIQNPMLFGFAQLFVEKIFALDFLHKVDKRFRWVGGLNQPTIQRMDL